MPGPNWSDDAPADAELLAANLTEVVADVHRLAVDRVALSAADLRRWHEDRYDGCVLPSAAYVGRFRGDPHPDVVDYEVAVGPDMPDGYPERAGVWAADVGAEVTTFFAAVAAAFTTLDGLLPPGQAPTTVDLLHEVVAVAGAVHGEWVRIHPFVNGNGRTARLLAAHVSLRYGLPIFVSTRPRPDDIAYARASKMSMGRPPDFSGDHAEATAVFTHLLSLHLLGL